MKFPIARFFWRLSKRALSNWLERHQHPFNFAIHLVGIPLAVVGLPLLFFTDWYYGVGAIVLGYFLQWVGHQVEGNHVGEMIPIRRALGLPVIAIVPRGEVSPSPAASDSTLPA